MSFPKDSDVFSSFTVKSDQTTHYALALLQPVAHSLAEAATVSLKTNSEGLLLVQIMIDVAALRSSSGRVSTLQSTSSVNNIFVDFYLIPNKEDVEPDDSEQI